MRIIAHSDRAAGVDLRYAIIQNLITDVDRLTRSEDQARVRHAETQYCHEKLKVFILNLIRRMQCEIRANRRLDAREGDSMWSHSKLIFKMDSVIEQRHYLKTPVIKPHERADSKVINSGFHRTIKTVQTPEIATLRPTRMKLFIGLLMIGFLEDLIRSDACRLHSSEAFHIQGSSVDIHTADLSIPMLCVINCFHGIFDILRIILWMLAIHHDQPFVSHIHQCLGLFDKLLLCKSLAFAFRVRDSKAAICAVVDAFIADIKRRKKNNSIPINSLFQLSCSV